MRRKRVKITLHDDASAALRRLSLLSGESMSSVIASLFDPHVAAINRMADLLEEAADMRADLPDASRQILRSVLSDIREKSKPVNETEQPPIIDAERAAIIAECKRISATHPAGNSAISTNTENRSAQASACTSAGRLSELELMELEESTPNMGGCYE